MNLPPGSLFMLTPLGGEELNDDLAYLPLAALDQYALMHRSELRGEDYEERISALEARKVLLQMLPKGTHEYAKFIKPSELDQWIREAGLSMTHMTGMTYNPLTRIYKLNEGDVDVNYLVTARKNG